MAEAETDEGSHKASASEGFRKIWVWTKGHPYEAAAVGAFAFLILVWYFWGGSSAAAAPAQTGPNASNAATIAAELQQESINAQQTTALQAQQQAAAIAENNNASVLQSQSIQAATTLSLANILADIQGQQITTQGSVDLAAIASNSQIQAANAANTSQQISTSGQVALANINANETLGLNYDQTLAQEATLAALSNSVMALVPALQTGLQTNGAGFSIAASIPGLTTSTPITFNTGQAGATPATFQSQGFTNQQIASYFANTGFGP